MRRPDKNRFLQAAQHVEMEEIPIFEMDSDMEIVNQLLGQSYSCGLHPFELPAEANIEVNRRLGNDMVYFSHVWRVGRKEVLDEQGRQHYVDGEIKTAADLDKVWFPDLDEMERRFEELVSGAIKAGMGVMYGTQSAPFTSTAAIGFEDFCLLTIDNPGFIHELQKRFHEYAMAELDMALQYPVDAIKIGSGLVDNTGPMLSPQMMEEFEFALMREQARMAKDKDLPLLLHIDGLVEPLMPTIFEMGVDILHPIDPCGGQQSIYELKERHGDRIVLCGNIDINGVLLTGTPDQVAEDVTEHMRKLARGGGYIVSSSHNLHSMIPIENVHAMRDAVHEYRYTY